MITQNNSKSNAIESPNLFGKSDIYSRENFKQQIDKDLTMKEKEFNLVHSHIFIMHKTKKFNLEKLLSPPI